VYEVPAMAPIAFNVQIRFAPGGDGQVVWHDGSPAPPVSRAIAGTGAAGSTQPPPPAPGEPIRIGGNIASPKRVKNVPPVYPPIAQSARVSGTVIVEVTIGADGRVTNATILRSIPLLDQAALDAVKQWVFTPTLLNNVPVPVIMTVTVNFTLQ
jgi:protein TonB